MSAIVLAAYAAGWLLAAAVATRWFAVEVGEVEVGIQDAALGALAAILWPLAAPIAIVYWLARRETPAERRDRLAIERDHRIAEQAARIRQLERDAGIR